MLARMPCYHLFTNSTMGWVRCSVHLVLIYARHSPGAGLLKFTDFVSIIPWYVYSSICPRDERGTPQYLCWKEGYPFEISLAPVPSHLLYPYNLGLTTDRHLSQVPFSQASKWRNNTAVSMKRSPNCRSSLLRIPTSLSKLAVTRASDSTVTHASLNQPSN